MNLVQKEGRRGFLKGISLHSYAHISAQNINENLDEKREQYNFIDYSDKFKA